MEEALVAMGVAVWPMIELEADDALASAARIAATDRRVEKFCLWTVDKTSRMRPRRPDRAGGSQGAKDFRCRRRAPEIRRRAGADPDFLALVGDAADGYPASPESERSRRTSPQSPWRDRNLPAGSARRRSRARTAVQKLATLRTDAPLFDTVDELRWRGPNCGFAAWTERMEAPRLLARAEKASSSWSRSIDPGLAASFPARWDRRGSG